jgi:hypothetical protein
VLEEKSRIFIGTASNSHEKGRPETMLKIEKSLADPLTKGTCESKISMIVLQLGDSISNRRVITEWA